MKIAQRQALRYEYNGNNYKIIFIAKMKIGQLWVKCVVYQSYSDNRIWVREHGDFFEKFNEIKSPAANGTKK